jgi:hypothetical protein
MVYPTVLPSQIYVVTPIDAVKLRSVAPGQTAGAAACWTCGIVPAEFDRLAGLC